MAFVDGQTLTAAQLNAAFGACMQASALQSLATTVGVLTAGDFVNVYDNSGIISVRRADGSDPTAFATGFVLNSYSDGQIAKVYLLGLNSAVTVGTSASEVWLSDTTPGGFVTTPTSTSGSIIQPLGVALAGAGIFFIPHSRIQL